MAGRSRARCDRRIETRAGTSLGAHVVRYAEHRDIGIDLPPVGNRRSLAEGALPDE
ncbi:MAG: hypothetical protein KDG54_00160 [Geminicoccaceae bacterium]|nr:hypothetical protein [Geminicoccaceae bacterium]